MVFKNYSQKIDPLIQEIQWLQTEESLHSLVVIKWQLTYLMAILILYGVFGITQLKRQLMLGFWTRAD